MQERTHWNKSSRAAALCLALCAAFFTVTARADDTFPTRPVRLVCGQAAGTGMDTVSRLLAQEVTKSIGQQVFVENKPGAGGNIGADFVAKSPADGYTLFMSGNGSAVINPFLYKEMPFKYEDLVPVTLVGYLPLVIVVSPKSGFGSLAGLVNAAKAQPGKLNFGTPGVGTSNHLTAELFKLKAKIDTVHVPYKTLMAPDLISGTLDYTFDAIASSMPFIKAGTLRALAVTTKERSAALPDVPTVAEQGYPDFAASIWYMVLVPARTPAAVVRKLNQAFVTAARQPEAAARIASMGVTIRATSPEEAQAFMDAQYREMGALIRTAGIKAE
jgi:tripartite-type tricarboxylate transporter receptor subunit TctC